MEPSNRAGALSLSPWYKITLTALCALLLHLAGLWALPPLNGGRPLRAPDPPDLRVRIIPIAPLTPPPVPKPEAEPELAPEPEPEPEPAKTTHQAKKAPLPPPERIVIPVAAAPAPAPLALPAAPTNAPPPLRSLPAEGGPSEPVGVETPPSFKADYLSNPAPAYPRMSRELGEEGRVVLRVLVGDDGKPRDVQVHAGSGFDRLDRAALDTVRRWQFTPARRGVQPIEGWVLVPIKFDLQAKM